MALYENQEKVKPDAYTGDSDELTKTNTNLIKDKGDAPSGKKMIDPRLPKLTKFHFGGQSGWVTLPKGRIVSIDPSKVRKSFDDEKTYNVITMANGGVDVSETNDDPQADSDSYIRVANKPVGVASMNVYQDLDDRFAGNLPGFVTRNTINLPYFEKREDAEGTIWGSAYGSDLKAGDKVKSDENGRFVKWEEHKTRTQVFSGDGSKTTFQVDFSIFPEGAIEVEDTDAGSTISVDSVVYATGEITLSSAPNSATDNVEITYKSVAGDDLSQIVGQVVNVDTNMRPAGWLKWVMPEDNYNEPTGIQPYELTTDGYPYDPAYMEGYGEDLFPTGIPGLTDGSEIIVNESDVSIGTIPADQEAGETFYMHVPEKYEPVLEDGNAVLKFTDDSGTTTDVTSECLERIEGEAGLFVVTLSSDYNTADNATEYDVTVDFNRNHAYPGMPSHINFDGVLGSIDILLQL